MACSFYPSDEFGVHSPQLRCTGYSSRIRSSKNRIVQCTIVQCIIVLCKYKYYRLWSLLITWGLNKRSFLLIIFFSLLLSYFMHIIEIKMTIGNYTHPFPFFPLSLSYIDSWCIERLLQLLEGPCSCLLWLLMLMLNSILTGRGMWIIGRFL